LTFRDFVISRFRDLNFEIAQSRIREIAQFK